LPPELGPRTISVLILEDNQADAKLMLYSLQQAGFFVQGHIARTSVEFQETIASANIDLVLADYNLPDWTGLDAIRWLRESGIGIPLILVTGSLGDEHAVACIKEGASDYVLKDKLDHLPIAVTHALEQQRLRRSRDQAIEQLHETASEYRLLFNSNPQPMWVYDLESLRFLAVNDAAINHYGYSREEFLRMTLRDIRPEEEIPRLLTNLAAGRNRKQLETAGTWKHRKKTGEIIDVKIMEGKLQFEGRSAALIGVEDVTERQVLERQFLQAQKMEAVGRLAGGVAHDFNNLLMVIGSSAQLIRDRLDDQKNIARYANQIEDAANKAANLTRQLLAFSRQQVLEPRVLDLNAVITDIGRMLKRLLGEDIEIMFLLDPALGKINADSGQIEQIIMNLGVNARDAMPSGGKLIIETSNVELNSDYLDHHGIKGKPGSYVRVGVSDTGCGMTPEVQSRIFEPFFTTKELGKGTGLGLATVYGIVKQSNGWIWVYSEVGLGTSFKIYLPRTEEQPNSPLQPVATAMVRGTETILLVEDEQILRQVTSEYLEDKGYRVLQAESGPQAAAILKNYAGTIHLLITDMVMPGFGGTKLAEICAATRPDTRIIYMSGYAEGALNQTLTGRNTLYLQKPLSLTSLAQKLRSLLDQAS
jgi:two-component system, cell cycle sensor histidine kinase and response regulator CckA